MLLGNVPVALQPFAERERVLARFRGKAFKALSARKKFEDVNKSLLTLIQNADDPCFLLPAVIDYIACVNKEKFLLEPYRMLQFEFWLNHYSNISDEENWKVRCKIVGKTINRDDYQLFFPIGMRKVLTGSHFVAAHMSPDIDTTIASFWGWVDAFGARVGTGVHHWSLPGSYPDSTLALLFETLFGKDVLDVVAKETATLSLTALDLVSNKGVLKLHTKSRLTHVHAGSHIVAVDDKGHFKGDWRPSDAEAVRQVVLSFYSLIRWLEHTIYYRLISTYAKMKVTKKDIQKALDDLFSIKLYESEPAMEFSESQRHQVDIFIKKVLKISKGLQISFKELVETLSKAMNIPLPSYEFVPKAIFDSVGTLKENRPEIFTHLEKLFRASADASSACRHFLDRLDVLLAIKREVLNIPSQFITLKSDVEEIRTKMNSLEYLTVAIPEEEGNWFPVGVVYANDIRRKTLGTVSLRDFSNEGETKMASYLEVVSIIDHHKSNIATSTAATIIIGDAQSANTIVAEQVVKLNQRYSLLGMTPKEIDREKKALSANAKSASDLGKLKRLAELAINGEKNHKQYIHPVREYSEYLFFLHAILDDTDLLTKVSKRDLDLLATLLNRMKSLACKKDSEIISFDNIPQNDRYIEEATKRILQNEDMYSIYKKIYAHKEKEVETNIARCLKGRPSTIFLDTKVQNGCCRIGQTKLFSTNYPIFAEHADRLKSLWLAESKKVYSQTPQIDLHMQMITTIATADEVYHPKSSKWKHQDELWFWVPPVQGAMEHLVNFLNAFTATQIIQQNDMHVEFLGENFWDLQLLFSQNFPKAIQSVNKEKMLPIAVLRFKAGLLNSRKAFITPYLPRLLA